MASPIQNGTLQKYQQWMSYPWLSLKKFDIFNCGFPTEMTCEFLSALLYMFKGHTIVHV